MRKIILFLAISLLLHISLLLVHIDKSVPKPKTTVPVEITSRGTVGAHPAPVEQPPAEQPVAPIEPIAPVADELISAPAPATVANPQVVQAPSNVDNGSIVTQTPQNHEDIGGNTALPPIEPREYDPENPPMPMTVSDIIREQLAQSGGGDSDGVGPDRRIEDIVRENLADDSYPEGEGGASFNSLNSKYNSYMYQFSKELYSIWQYPRESASKGHSGITRVKFSITKEGEITDIRIVETSGYPDLDREVMRTLKSMNRTPLAPYIDLNVLHITGYFIYTVNGEYRIY